ncbi:MAG: hypothetical protein OXU81_08350 [Gammaproteobacteria bacterium]|nr:hypothetical protein [Gammaproteobacteria bacterium]
MASLEPAHRGYEYQDLIVACRLVDVLLGSITVAEVDKKFVPGDRFDDLTTVDYVGTRERVQIKHTDRPGQPLTVNTFASERRQLRLDELVRVALEDKDGPGAEANDHCFRVILMDAAPTDPDLVAILGLADRDPGPLVRGMRSLRMKLRPDALWSHYEDGSGNRPARDGPFSFLSGARHRVSRGDIDWVCEHVVVELNAPIASLDLAAPDAAERILLQRVREEIGAGAYPNQHRAPVDVAAALIDSARAARRGSAAVEPAVLLRRTGLRTDFGAVARRDPVNTAIEVSRPQGVADVVAEATEAASQQKPIMLVGPPGQGKSWICKQVVDALHGEGWLVAEHYCYLGDADTERHPRVLAESIFGSLLGRIGEQDHEVVDEQRPRFAASHGAVEQVVSEALRRVPQRRVALVVDGVDHVTRIVGGSSGHDPSFALVQELALLDLPVGSTLIVLSQPGMHLEPLEKTGAARLTLPGLTEEELDRLAGHLGVMDYGNGACDAEPFIRTLAHKSQGNALYATYLCREALRVASMPADPSAAISSLPPFDGTLQSYYEHIQESLGSEAAWVSDILGLVDFPLTRSELKEIRPDAAHRVDKAVEVLGPALSEHAGQSGIRIYHESYARFLQEPYRKNTTAKVALLELVIQWLDGQGIFEDTRAYRHLLRTLSVAGHHERVVEAVDRRFVIESISRGFPASAIVENLVVGINSAARTGNWPAIVRYVEMSRSAETYQEERFESVIVGYADVVGELLGASAVAERLLHDGRPTMVARHGIQMCARVDAMGAVAPWAEYMDAYLRESEEDNTIYGDVSERSVALAWMRGRLRLASLGQDARREDESSTLRGGQVGARGSFDAPVDWDRFAEWIGESDLGAPSVVEAVLDTIGYSGVVELISRLKEPGPYYLAVAEAIRAGRLVGGTGDFGKWVSKAVESGVPAGYAERLIALGCDPADLAREGTADARVRLRELTLALQDPLGHHEGERVAEWIDACTVAARVDSLFLTAVEALIDGPGWYACWLRFVVRLSIAESESVEKQSKGSLRAIRILAEVDNPFLGDPRACDLYPIHGLIGQTLWRAVGLLSDGEWKVGLEVLDRVSNATSTTISGELGGPLPRDLFLDLVVGTANATRHGVAEGFVEDEIKNGGHGRFYEDLARFRLAAARLALRGGDQDGARRRWSQACELLTAYGWRKDITVQELLQPLETMISIAPESGRTAVAKLQGLCERIPQHTDGKSTSRTPNEWRRLLAAADPCALAEIIARSLFESCNDPNAGLHEARSDLWRAWHGRADPVVSAALRLTLEEPLDDSDSASLARLANETPRQVPEQMLVALLARVDERPLRYGYSNSDELVDKDSRRVEELNAIAKAAGLPEVVVVARKRWSPVQGLASRGRSEVSVARRAESVVVGFPPGMPGVAFAVRAWRDRSYDDTSEALSSDRFATILGYRIVELAEDGLRDDAETALHLLADAVPFGDRDGLLKAIAEGLERHGQTALAVIAYTLAWTRTRGRGGWMTFGGETEMVSLRVAAGMDRALVKETLAGEVERVIAHGVGSIGVTQALTLAFANGCLSSDCADSFAMWEEALAVISARTPRVSDLDDPEHVYAAPEADQGEAVAGDIDAAFATAALAGITHPGREQKRRSFVAAWTLVNERAPMMARAIDLALRSVSDPATLTWLLRLIAVAGDNATDIVRGSREALVRLAESPWLTVRVLARSLVRNGEVALGAASDPDRELLGGGPHRIIVPEAADENSRDSGSADIVFFQAGVRLSRAQRILPGIIDAVIRRFREASGGDALQKRMRRQLRALETAARRHWPDAFLAWSEAIEDAMQRVGSGVRVAKLMSGDLATRPRELERQLADVLLDDPMVPINLEEARVPRPDIPAPPSRSDSVWSALSTSAGLSASGTDEDDDEIRVCGTVETTGHEAVPLLTNGPFAGWRLVATVEQRTLPQDGYQTDPKDDSAVRYRCIELRTDGAERGLGSSPVVEGDSALWYGNGEAGGADRQVVGTGAIVGLDSALKFAADGPYGLGLPPNVLVPTRRLIELLDLKLGRGPTLDDAAGQALALLVWRTEYETSEYHLPWPRLVGTGLVLRDDLLDRLVGLAQGRLVFRDFLEGSGGLKV